MNAPVKILVVDDELGIRDLLSSELASPDRRIVTASNGQEAVERVKQEKFQLVISDIKMPKMGGLEMLEAIKKIDPDVEVIMSTGYGTIETAVHAMKKGAYDFIQKPFNMDEITALIDKALEKNELKTLIGIYESSKAVFSSVKLDALLPITARVAAQILRADDASIMLAGPAGRLTVLTAVGVEGEEEKTSRLALGERVLGSAPAGAGPEIVPGPLERDPRFSGIAGLGRIGSAIVFPLTVGGKLVGLLNANRTAAPEPFTAAELRHATIFGSQIAQAIHNANLYRELEKKIQQIQEMQSQLVQSEKLAAVGLLAAGVAHEINNPLTGILGFTELLLAGQGLTAEQREDLGSIRQEGKRCRDIVSHLLQFSRRRKPVVEPVRVADVLQRTLELVRYDLRTAAIDVRVDIPESLPSISGDAGQLEQVFLNIVTNARHALEGKAGGVIEIRARCERDRLVIRIKDNGCGIAAENLGRVFDPFFTTKPVGKGTGLGMSISYGIISEHGGTIRVDGAPGAGAEFCIELPLKKKA